jgi:hypothetical protein
MRICPSIPRTQTSIRNKSSCVPLYFFVALSIATCFVFLRHCVPFWMIFKGLRGVMSQAIKLFRIQRLVTSVLPNTSGVHPTFAPPPPAHKKIISTNILYFLKSNIFWDITPCSPLKVNRRLGGTYRSVCHLLSRWFLAELIRRPWRWRRYVPPKRRLTFNGLHGVITQKIIFFITTAVRKKDRELISMWKCWIIKECRCDNLEEVSGWIRVYFVTYYWSKVGPILRRLRRRFIDEPNFRISTGALFYTCRNFCLVYWLSFHGHCEWRRIWSKFV